MENSVQIAEVRDRKQSVSAVTADGNRKILLYCQNSVRNAANHLFKEYKISYTFRYPNMLEKLPVTNAVYEDGRKDKDQ